MRSVYNFSPERKRDRKADRFFVNKFSVHVIVRIMRFIEQGGTFTQASNQFGLLPLEVRKKFKTESNQGIEAGDLEHLFTIYNHLKPLPYRTIYFHKGQTEYFRKEDEYGVRMDYSADKLKGEELEILNSIHGNSSLYAQRKRWGLHHNG